MFYISYIQHRNYYQYFEAVHAFIFTETLLQRKMVIKGNRCFPGKYCMHNVSRKKKICICIDGAVFINKNMHINVHIYTHIYTALTVYIFFPFETAIPIASPGDVGDRTSSHLLPKSIQFSFFFPDHTKGFASRTPGGRSRFVF